MKRKLAARGTPAAQVHVHIGQWLIDRAALDGDTPVPWELALREAVTQRLIGTPRPLGGEYCSAARALEPVAEAIAARLRTSLADAPAAQRRTSRASR